MESGGGRGGELKCPHFLTAHLHKEAGGALQWGGGWVGGFFFFGLGLPSIPTPQLSEVTPPLTLPRLFPVALSALIVADWLNVEKPKMEGPGVEKKEKEGEDFGKGGEKREGRGRERPFFFFFSTEITDYLTQINNLSLFLSHSCKRGGRGP